MNKIGFQSLDVKMTFETIFSSISPVLKISLVMRVINGDPYSLSRSLLVNNQTCTYTRPFFFGQSPYTRLHKAMSHLDQKDIGLARLIHWRVWTKFGSGLRTEGIIPGPFRTPSLS